MENQLCLHLIDRATAKKVGLKRYFTGVQCRRGHVTERLTAGAICARCNSELVADHYKRNKASIRARQNAYFKQNRDEVNRKALEWYRRSGRNKEINANHCMIRRARCRVAKPSWYSDFDDFVMLEAADLTRIRTAITGVQWHIDHMIPLRAKKACGLHCADNIQVIPAKMNHEKKNRMIFTEKLAWLR